jgi:hypothetical protein
MPRPFDVQARRRGYGTASRNTSASAWCAGQFVAGHAVGEHHVLATPKLCAPDRRDVRYGPAADDDEGGAGHPLPDRGHRPD